MGGYLKGFRFRLHYSPITLRNEKVNLYRTGAYYVGPSKDYSKDAVIVDYCDAGEWSSERPPPVKSFLIKQTKDGDGLHKNYTIMRGTIMGDEQTVDYESSSKNPVFDKGDSFLDVLETVKTLISNPGESEKFRPTTRRPRAIPRTAGRKPGTRKARAKKTGKTPGTKTKKEKKTGKTKKTGH